MKRNLVNKINEFEPPKKKRKENKEIMFLSVNGVGDYNISYLLIYSEENEKFIKMFKGWIILDIGQCSDVQILIKYVNSEDINCLERLNRMDIVNVFIDYTDYSSIYNYFYRKYGHKDLYDMNADDRKIIDIISAKMCGHHHDDSNMLKELLKKIN